MSFSLFDSRGNQDKRENLFVPKPGKRRLRFCGLAQLSCLPAVTLCSSVFRCVAAVCSFWSCSSPVFCIWILVKLHTQQNITACLNDFRGCCILPLPLSFKWKKFDWVACMSCVFSSGCLKFLPIICYLKRILGYSVEVLLLEMISINIWPVK